MVSLQDLDVSMEITEWSVAASIGGGSIKMILIQGVGVWFYIMPMDDELQQLEAARADLGKPLKD